MSNKFFIGGIIAGAVGVTILQGGLQTPAPNISSRKKKKRHDAFSELAGLDLEKVFPGELAKFTQFLEHLMRDTPFIHSYEKFQKELEGENEYVILQLTLGAVMSIIAANCCVGLSRFIPKGLAFDTILRCELDSMAVIGEEGSNEDLTPAMVELYNQIKNGVNQGL